MNESGALLFHNINNRSWQPEGRRHILQDIPNGTWDSTQESKYNTINVATCFDHEIWLDSYF